MCSKISEERPAVGSTALVFHVERTAHLTEIQLRWSGFFVEALFGYDIVFKRTVFNHLGGFADPFVKHFYDRTGLNIDPLFGL